MAVATGPFSCGLVSQLGNAGAIAAIARPHHGPNRDRIGCKPHAPSGGQPFPRGWGCLQ